VKTPIDLFIELKGKRLQTGREMPRRFQIVMHRALWEHASGTRPLDPEMAGEIAFAMRDVIGGVAGQLVTPYVRPGGKVREPIERSCIEDAVRYRRAVGAGLLKDRHPIKSILEAFGGSDPMNGGISRRTVQLWCSGKEFEKVTIIGFQPEQISWLMLFSGRYFTRNCTKTARAKMAR
jgi:hypothetical protein